MSILKRKVSGKKIYKRRRERERDREILF